MKIDTSFDVRTDTPGGKDPDSHSPTLRQYHKLLWSRSLPNGALFDLNVRGTCLHHRSELGEFSLSSDRVIQTFTRWKSLKHITEQFPEEENEAFRTIGNTIGGMMVFPSNKIDGKPTINSARGFNFKTEIADRLDLTLECIRRHYIVQDSPLAETLERYRDFFALFENFREYADFFMLNDLVADHDSKVKFFMPFVDFNFPSVPRDVDTYREYRRLSIEFIKARNRRIDRHSISSR